MKRAPWKPNDTLNAAKLASRAGRRHLNRLASRGLDETFFAELDGEVAQFEMLHGGQATQREQLRGKTRKLSEVLEEATRLATGLRQAILLTFPPRHPARAHFGTGMKSAKESVPQTLKLPARAPGTDAESQGLHVAPAAPKGSGAPRRAFRRWSCRSRSKVIT